MRNGVDTDAERDSRAAVARFTGELYFLFSKTFVSMFSLGFVRHVERLRCMTKARTLLGVSFSNIPLTKWELTAGPWQEQREGSCVNKVLC